MIDSDPHPACEPLFCVPPQPSRSGQEPRAYEGILAALSALPASRQPEIPRSGQDGRKIPENPLVDGVNERLGARLSVF